MTTDHIPSTRIANKQETAEFFGVAPNAVDGWLRRGCPVLERGHKTAPYRFDLRAVAEWYYSGKTTSSGGEVDPEALPPKERLDWYNGEKARRALQMQDGELIPAAEVEIELAALIKSFAGFLEVLPFTLERECGLSGDVVERLQVAIDQQRELLHERLSA